jgi:hypothetical protein
MIAASNPPKILVVAAHDDLRHSLAFLLSAEGFRPEIRDTWITGDDHGAADSVIIDHASFPENYVDDGALAGLGNRLVVLNSRPAPPAGLPSATVVRKPLLYQELIEALRSVLH